MSKYYEPQEGIITVHQRWHVHVPARRYFAKAVADIMNELQPTRKCFWKPSLIKSNGYQATLITSSIDLLDSEQCLHYPDW